MLLRSGRGAQSKTTPTTKDDHDSESQYDRAWALVGAQSLLCTLAFLALLFLNFQIWKQYFFLILWSFVLSHAFKSTLDDLQEWAESLAAKLEKAESRNLVCSLCAGMFRQNGGNHDGFAVTCRTW